MRRVADEKTKHGQMGTRSRMLRISQSRQLVNSWNKMIPYVALVFAFTPIENRQ